MHTFTHKGYGRIYCEIGQVDKVKEVIRSMDEYEYDTYCPGNLVAEFTEYPTVVYLHKFSDTDVDEICARCWKAGLRVWIFDSGHTDEPRDLTFDTSLKL